MVAGISGTDPGAELQLGRELLAASESHDSAVARRAAPGAKPADVWGCTSLDDRATTEWGSDEVRELAARLKSTARLLRSRDPISARAFERGGRRFERLATMLDAASSDPRVLDAWRLLQRLNVVVGKTCFLGVVAMRLVDGRRGEGVTAEPPGRLGAVGSSPACGGRVSLGRSASDVEGRSR